MARLHRQELKHDEFVDTFDELLLYVEEHGWLLLTLVLAVVLAGGTLGGFYWYSLRQERQATTALGAALLTYEAPVQTGLPPLPGEGPQKTFPSESAKLQAAEKEFAAVRQNFPRTRAALLSKHYEALCKFENGETQAALAALEELSRAPDRNVAALAQHRLAGFYESQGRRADAEKLYRQLAEHPTITVPRATAMLALANLLAASNPLEARQLLEQVRVEYPNTTISAEATRRLDLLPGRSPAGAPASQP